MSDTNASTGPAPGFVRLTIQDHAESENPPAPRILDVPFTTIPINDDGTVTLPDGPVRLMPQAS